MNELTANMKTEEAIKEKIKESRFESINGKDLMEMDLPPLHYTISTILPHGFFILAGGAKVGKSWRPTVWGLRIPRCLCRCREAPWSWRLTGKVWST